MPAPIPLDEPVTIAIFPSSESLELDAIFEEAAVHRQQRD